MKYMSVTHAKVNMLFTFITNITQCCAVHSVTCNVSLLLRTTRKPTQITPFVFLVGARVNLMTTCSIVSRRA